MPDLGVQEEQKRPRRSWGITLIALLLFIRGVFWVPVLLGGYGPDLGATNEITGEPMMIGDPLWWVALLIVSASIAAGVGLWRRDHWARWLTILLFGFEILWRVVEGFTLRALLPIRINFLIPWIIVVYLLVPSVVRRYEDRGEIDLPDPQAAG